MRVKVRVRNRVRVLFKLSNMDMVRVSKFLRLVYG